MSKVDKFARIRVKRSIIPTLSATTAPSDDHTMLPAWSTTDIYVGEFFLNEVDEKLWLRINDTTIKRLLFEGDVIVTSGGTYGTSGTSGKNGSSGSSGINGTSGSFTGVTVNDQFYYISGNTTLYVPLIVSSGLTLTGLTSSGSTNYIVTDTNGKLYITTVIGITEDVPVSADNGTSSVTRTLHFINGLYTGYTDAT